MHYVILGNGIAGMEAAITLRNRDSTARITLVSAEHDHFFSRTALMYILCGQLRVEDTEPYGRDLYRRMRFERVGGRVTGLEPSVKTLIFEDGGRLGYDRLLLAVGSRGRPAPWPGSGPDVHYFVTLSDLQRLDAEAQAGTSVVVIGGGLIGVEVAEVLHLRGCKVHFLIREPWYFPVALDPREAEVVASHIRKHGVEVRTRTIVAELLRDAAGKLRGVQTGDGEEIAATVVIAAIGVTPATDFLRGSGLEMDAAGGIEVDAGLRTNLPEVWAAGDCATVTWVDGSRRPEQLWYTGRDQGRVAAASMLGDTTEYRRLHWYNSAKFFDLEYTTAGYLPPPLNQPTLPAGTRSWYQENPATSTTQRILLKDQRVVGFNCLGSRWDHSVFLRWIAERRSLEWVLAHMNEARFDEEFMAPFRVLPSATLSPVE